MKLDDIVLIEGAEFHAAIIKTGDDGHQIYDSAHFQKAVKVKCWVCEGTGIDPYNPNNIACDMCDGTKQITEYQTPYRQLQVAYGNLSAIMDALNWPNEEGMGAWEAKDLPEIRRRLIRLKNDSDNLLSSETEVSKAHIKDKDENGLTRIRRGPTVYNIGRTDQQVANYIDRLLELIDFAQKNGAIVSWA